MNYATDNLSDMTYDEYMYEVDMLLIGETGEPATGEQLFDIAAGWNNGLTPWQSFTAINDAAMEGSALEDIAA